MILKKYILTICIATYNRSDFLKVTISEIISQAKLFADVEILVVDGNSTDNTFKVMSDFSKNHENVSYFQLSQKGGVDKDYDIAVKKAKGEYCWLFTDDDFIEKNTVSYLRNQLLKNNIELLIINAKICDYNLKKNLKENALGIKENLKINFKNHEPGYFLEKTSPHITFIGCVIIKKQLWVKYSNKELYGSRFIHVGIISKLPQNTKSLILSKSLIKIRLGNAEWNNITFLVWNYLWPKLIWSFPNITKDVKKKITPLKPWKSFKFLLWYRALECYSYKEYVKYINHEKFSLLKLMAFLISITPKILPKLLFIVLSKLKKDPLIKYYLGEGSKSKNSWFS